MDAYLGEIRLTAFDFAPKEWMLCQGQLLNINEHRELFSLIGTTYGGNGQTTFALPDLRSRLILGAGQAPGFSKYVQGEQGGAESVLPNEQQMPAHSHPFTATIATAGVAESGMPDGGLPAAGAAKQFSKGTPNATLGPNSLTGKTSVSGGGQPHANRQPLMALNYLIAIKGMLPPRD